MILAFPFFTLPSFNVVWENRALSGNVVFHGGKEVKGEMIESADM